MRARFLPSTSTLTVPSGRRSSWRMVPRVPISKMSSGAGSLVLAFFCAARRMSLSCAIASSSAAMDFSRPTKSGTTMCGKTMMSRSGSSGTVRVPGLFPFGSFFSSLRKNIGVLASREGSAGRRCRSVTLRSGEVSRRNPAHIQRPADHPAFPPGHSCARIHRLRTLARAASRRGVPCATWWRSSARRTAAGSPKSWRCPGRWHSERPATRRCEPQRRWCCAHWPTGWSTAGAAPTRWRSSSCLLEPPCGPSGGLCLLLVNDQRRFLLHDALFAEHDLADVLVRGHLVHHVEHRALEDGPQPARAALVVDGLPGHRPQRAVGELELHAVHLQQLAVLLGEGIPRLGEDVHQRHLVQLLQRGHHRQPADELGDHAELEQVLGLNVSQELRHVALVLRGDLRPEPQRLPLLALLDDVLQPAERAAADEEDVGGVYLQELLLRVLPPALGRNVGDGPLDDLQESLLHALAGDVARDRRVLALARDLVDLVDVDDALLRPLDVVVGGLQEVDDDVLHVRADVPGLGQAGGVGDGEGNVEDARQRLRQQRLAAPGGAEQQDVALLQLDVVHRDLALDALVVVVDGDAEDLLRPLLPHHVLVEDGLDLGGPRDAQLLVSRLLLVDLLRDDVVAQPDALVADVDRRPCDQLLDLLLRLSAEGAAEGVVFALVDHGYPNLTLLWRCGRFLDDDLVDQAVLLCLTCAHEVVAVGVLLDAVERLPGVLLHDFIELCLEPQDLLGVELDVACLPAEAPGRLVDHDPRVGERVALALGAGGQQQRAHRRRLPHADGRDLTLHVLHGVVDGQARSHRPAR